MTISLSALEGINDLCIVRRSLMDECRMFLGLSKASARNVTDSYLAYSFLSLGDSMSEVFNLESVMKIFKVCEIAENGKRRQVSLVGLHEKSRVPVFLVLFVSYEGMLGLKFSIYFCYEWLSEVYSNMTD